MERELRIRNYSPKTVKSYFYGLREYLVFKKDNLEILNQENIRNFLLQREQKGTSPLHTQVTNPKLKNIKSPLE